MTLRVTATLKNWEYDEEDNAYFGYVYGDVYNRWPDGTYIQTSEVLDMGVCPGELYVKTKYSFYRLL